MCVGGAGVISIGDRVKLMRLTDVLALAHVGVTGVSPGYPNPGTSVKCSHQRDKDPAFPLALTAWRSLQFCARRGESLMGILSSGNRKREMETAG